MYNQVISFSVEGAFKTNLLRTDFKGTFAFFLFQLHLR